MVIYPLSKSIQTKRKDRYDETVEEIWITALSNAGGSRNDDMPDSTTRSRGKSTIKLLPKVSG